MTRAGFHREFALIACAAAVFVAACAATPGLSAADAADPIATLESMAATARPAGSKQRDAGTQLQPRLATPGLESIPDPVPPNDPARGSLEEALTQLPPYQPTAQVDLDAEVTESDALHASRLYARGRVARMDGRNAQAIDLLTEASELNPVSASIWQELASAERSRGNQLAADAALARAVAADPDNPRMLLLLAIRSIERDMLAEAASILRSLRDLDSQTANSAERALADSLLARVFQEQGKLQASVEAMRGALDELPSASSVPQSLEPQIAALRRAAPNAWLGIGDIEIRLGHPGKAIDAYHRALDGAAPADLRAVPRLVHAQLLADNPPAAALTVLRSIQRSQGHADALSLELLGFIAQQMDDPAILASAIDKVYEQLPASPSLADDRALARATLEQQPDRSFGILFDAFTQDASAERLIDAAIASADDPAAAHQRASALIGAAPLRAEEIALVLIASSEPAPSASDTTLSASNPAASILEAWLAYHTGHSDRGIRLAQTAVEQHPAETGTWYTLGRIAARLDRREHVDRSLDRLADLAASAPAETDRLTAAIAFAQVASMVGRRREATDLLLAAPDSDTIPLSRRVDRLVLLSRMLLDQGRTEEAAGFADRAATLIPGREDASNARLAVARVTGDNTLAQEVADGLNETAPFGRALRSLRAVEAIRNNQNESAYRLLEDLFEERPFDGEVLTTLARLMANREGTDAALEWVRGLRERFPALADTAIAEATMLTLSAKARQGVDLLTEQLARYPGQTNLSVAAESILRESLGDSRGAAELALARSNRLPDLPDVLAHRGAALLALERNEEAREVLERAVDSAIAENDEQQLDRLILLLFAAATAEEGSTDTLGHTQLQVAEHARSLEEPQLEALVRLQFLRDDPPVEQVLAIIDRSTEDDPALAASLYQLGMTIVPADSDRRNVILLTASQRAARNDLDRNGVFFNVWLLTANQLSRTDDLEAALRLAAEKDLLIPTLLGPAVVNQRDIETVRQQAAQLLYALAVQTFGDSGTRPTSRWLLRQALHLNPLHAQANNSLGYQLLEERRDLDLVARLLAVAYHEGRNEPNIVDSWGWLLYRAGRFTDGPDGQGAISVLEESIRLLARNAQNSLVTPVVREHLGDAYFAAGREQEAADAWSLAAAEAQSALELLTNRGVDVRNDPLAAEIRLALENAQRKTSAIDEGHKPSIAEVYGDITVPNPEELVERIQEGQSHLPPITETIDGL